MDKRLILKTLVGSRANGLHRPDSDFDYRGVYVLPTKTILDLHHSYKGTSWIEGKEDDVSYEIGHFLQLAIKCNPSILEVFRGHIMFAMEDGIELRKLFDFVWNPIDAFNAFIGYSYNQRKKMLDKKDNRQNKYAVAYIRTLFNLMQLLSCGSFDLQITDKQEKEVLLEIRDGEWSMGEIINLAEDLIQQAVVLRDKCNHKSNLEEVNNFLIRIRKKYWN